MLKVVYVPDGIVPEEHELLLLPDGKVEEVVSAIVASYMITRHVLPDGTWHEYVSQGLIIDAFRVLVASGIISHDEIKFVYKDIEVDVDKHGHLSEWPDGFCDHMDRLLDKLLGI